MMDPKESDPPDERRDRSLVRLIYGVFALLVALLLTTVVLGIIVAR